jgi:hypothetical protein
MYVCLRISGAIPLLLLYAFMAWTMKIYPSQAFILFYTKSE